MNFKGGIGITKALRVTGKVGFPADHPFLDHFRFLAGTTSRRAEDDDPRARPCCTTGAAGR